MSCKKEDRQGSLIAAVVGLNHKVDKKLITEGVKTGYDLQVSGKIGKLSIDSQMQGAFTLTPSMDAEKTVKVSTPQLLALLLKQSSKRATGILRTILQEVVEAEEAIDAQLTAAEIKEATELLKSLDRKEKSTRSGTIKRVDA
ncbi:MAG: hypothetical protein COA78_24820 [Blastopirellula sp.]|nr:MAG: hypothetical protein COA78_24820 [Blastopirellula sp.]